MENWYYKSNDSEVGPVSIARLKQLAFAETITESTLVRRENMRSWLFAGKVKDIFSAEPAKLNPAETVASSPEGDPELVGSENRTSESVFSRMFSGVLSATVLVAKETQLKKLEWDRAAADERLGAKAFSGNHAMSANPICCIRIEEIDRGVIDLRHAEWVPVGESTKSKALRYGTELKIKIQIESMLLERQRLLRELGAVFRQQDNTSVPIDVRNEHTAAKSFDEYIAKVKAEISEIESPTSRLSAKLLAYGTFFLAIAIIFLLAFIALRSFGANE